MTSLELGSEMETLALGERIGNRMVAGTFIGLVGELGAGKTTLVRGIAQGMGVDPAEVKSPTFVLHHVYKSKTIPLHHIDLYRLGNGAKLQELDLAFLLAEGAVVVEWADLTDVSAWGGSTITLIDQGGDRRRVEIVGLVI